MLLGPWLETQQASMRKKKKRETDLGGFLITTAISINSSERKT